MTKPKRPYYHNTLFDGANNMVLARAPISNRRVVKVGGSRGMLRVLMTTDDYDERVWPR